MAVVFLGVEMVSIFSCIHVYIVINHQIFNKYLNPNPKQTNVFIDQSGILTDLPTANKHFTRDIPLLGLYLRIIISTL